MPWKSKEAQRKRAKERYHDSSDKYKDKIKQANNKYDYKRVEDWKKFKANLECMDCGEKEALCFHHRNPEEKKFNLGNFLTKTKKQIAEELLKCDVLCLNCHYKRHKKERITKPVKYKSTLFPFKKPSKESLESVIWKMPISWIAKKYDVSHNTVKQWCKFYGLEYPKNRYWLRKENIVFIKGPEYII